MPLTRTADAINNARRATEGRKPIWAFIQATGRAWGEDNTLDDHVEGRLPTVDEVRAQAYLSLVHGADGLMFYAYTLIQSSKQRHYRIRDDAPELWEGISKLNHQLAELAPVISDQSHRTLLEPAADGLVHMARWSGPEGSFAVAVNTAALPTITTFRLPDCDATEMDVMFEQRKLLAQEQEPGRFGDVFQPHEVHVYSIQQDEGG